MDNTDKVWKTLWDISRESGRPYPNDITDIIEARGANRLGAYWVRKSFDKLEFLNIH